MVWANGQWSRLARCSTGLTTAPPLEAHQDILEVITAPLPTLRPPAASWWKVQESFHKTKQIPHLLSRWILTSLLRALSAWSHVYRPGLAFCYRHYSTSRLPVGNALLPLENYFPLLWKALGIFSWWSTASCGLGLWLAHAFCALAHRGLLSPAAARRPTLGLSVG